MPAGWGGAQGCSQHGAASSARPAPVVLPLRWPLPWTVLQADGALETGRLGSLYASDEPGPPRSREPHRRRGQPACGPPSGGGTPVRGEREAGAADGRRDGRGEGEGVGGRTFEPRAAAADPRSSPCLAETLAASRRRRSRRRSGSGPQDERGAGPAGWHRVKRGERGRAARGRQRIGAQRAARGACDRARARWAARRRRRRRQEDAAGGGVQQTGSDARAVACARALSLAESKKSLSAAGNLD